MLSVFIFSEYFIRQAAVVSIGHLKPERIDFSATVMI